MKIYADILFFINFISSYILLDLTARITRHRPRLMRHIFAAMLGAAAAVTGFCAGDIAGAVKVVSLILLPITAFGLRGADTVRQIIVFSLMSVVMAGIFVLISGSQTVRIRGGIMYFNLPVLRFLTMFAVSYLIIAASVWFVKRRKYVRCRCIEITLKDKTAALTALVDSGNVLTEPVTGIGVIVAEWESVKMLFGGIEYSELKKAAEKHKLWLIPYHSLGNTGGLIYAFLADDINVVSEKRHTGRLFVGITNEKLSAKNEYNALMGASL